MLLLFCIVCLSADQTKKEVNVLHYSLRPDLVILSTTKFEQSRAHTSFT
jgi:hypothetical protein